MLIRQDLIWLSAPPSRYGVCVLGRARHPLSRTPHFSRDLLLNNTQLLLLRVSKRLSVYDWAKPDRITTMGLAGDAAKGWFKWKVIGVGAIVALVGLIMLVLPQAEPSISDKNKKSGGGSGKLGGAIARRTAGGVLLALGVWIVWRTARSMTLSEAVAGHVANRITDSVFD
jgi:hypothetical protein